MFVLQIALNSLVSGTAILLMAVSLYLIHASARVLHVGLGATGAAAAYAFYAARAAGLAPGTQLGAAAFTAAALGLIFFCLLHGFIQKKQTLFALLVSLSLGAALESVIAMIFGSDGKLLIREVLPTLHWGSLYLNTPGAVTLSIGLALAAGFIFFSRLTAAGRRMRGVSESRVLSESLGIAPFRVQGALFVTASLVAAFVILMNGLQTSLSPGMGFHTVVLGFIALLLGGTGDLLGVAVASFLLALLPQFLIAFSGLSSSWNLTLVFALAFFILIFRPNGLFHHAGRRL